jgi:hypothetical protein
MIQHQPNNWNDEKESGLEAVETHSFQKCQNTIASQYQEPNQHP